MQARGERLGSTVECGRVETEDRAQCLVHADGAGAEVPVEGAHSHARRRHSRRLDGLRSRFAFDQVPGAGAQGGQAVAEPAGDASQVPALRLGQPFVAR
jgi:hypothetical protein